jgi:Ca-activated chloride channel family protein
MSDLTFLAPLRLLVLVLPVALAAGYLLLGVRRRRYAVRFTSLDLLDEVAPDRPGWRRHLPALGLLLGAVVASLAFARPAMAVENGKPQRIVILAIDTSISMEADDVAPSRQAAAKEAAGEFLDNLPDGVAVGVVGFDGAARQLISPTTRLDAVRHVIEGTELGEGTAIGEAVYLSLDAINEAADEVETVEDGQAVGTVVLMSDGETTEGRPNEEAAAEAKEQGIAINTIAFGTDAGVVSVPGVGEVPVPVNEQALSELARTTGGEALEAATADELGRVYEDLGESVDVEVERDEVTDWFAAGALGLLVLAGVGSLAWFGRLP